MCVNPYIAKRKDGTPVPVPCGKCLDCRKQYQNEWIFRLTQEAKRSVCPCFVTLTYNNENLPVGVDECTGELLSYVCKRDVQLFLKRLRKNGGKLMEKMRYFAVSEYGSKYNRAHYHLIIIAPNLTSAADLDKLVVKSWDLGFSKTRFATHKQFKYVCKYMNKIDERFHLVKPFRLYSRSIGLNFLTQKMVDYYLSTFDRTCLSGSCRIGLPRYYKKKLDEASNSVYGLKKSGLKYSDLLEQVQSLPGSKYYYLKDFTENFSWYFYKGIEYMAKEHIDAGRLTDNQLRQWAWYAYRKTHKVIEDLIYDDYRKLKSCQIRNRLIGDQSCTFDLPYDVILREASD